MSFKISLLCRRDLIFNFSVAFKGPFFLFQGGPERILFLPFWKGAEIGIFRVVRGVVCARDGVRVGEGGVNS
jgi:hypothetical protein